jgi:F1F0 ATPase subunit 2
MSIGFVVGVMLGVLFYGGLWITVRQLMITRHPIAVTLGSLILRMAAVLAGLLLVSRGRWQNVAACLVGLTAGRIAVGRLCT